MTAPNRIAAGDTLDFLTDVSAYLPADGWTFKMRLIPRFTTPVQAPITLTATTFNVTQYQIQAGPSTTANWAPGQYAWMSWVEKSGARHVLEGTQFSGELTIEPDPSTQVQGFDGRSQAQKAVDDLRAALATYVSSQGAIASYTIAGRSVTFRDPGQISAQLSFWRNEVFKERRAEKLAEGLADPKNVFVRWGSA